MASNLGKTLGQLATNHPGVQFTLHARQPGPTIPGGGRFDGPEITSPGPPRLPGMAIIHIGMPGEGFGETKPAEPGPGRAPKGPSGVLKPPDADAEEKPPMPKNPARKPRAFRGEQLE